MPWLKIDKLVETPKTKGYCYLPYPRHKKGCPNTGKCWHNNRRMKMLSDIMDISKPIYAVYNEFDLEAHVSWMRQRHPDWSDAQLKNVIYWQPKSRKQLGAEIDKFEKTYLVQGTPIISSGEYNGVDVYATMKAAGIELDKIKDMKICRHLVFIGSAKKMYHPT